jgi:photosystem II stability/assembly factor-like uncharacterized protein
VGVGGTILATGDGGANWAPQESGTSAYLYGVDFADAQRGWAVGEGGTILVTGDGGANWAPQESGTTAHLFEVAFANDARTGWAVDSGGGILATSDSGALGPSRKGARTRTQTYLGLSSPTRSAVGRWAAVAASSPPAAPSGHHR